MARTLGSGVLGVFLLIYGAGTMLMAWWGYSVTHEAYSSVRSFATVFDQERAQVTEALQGVTGLLAGQPAATSAAAPSSGTAPAQGLRDRLQSLFRSAPVAPVPQAGAGPQPSDFVGLFGELESRIGRVNTAWSLLSGGPIRLELLDRVELITNIILIWLAINGIASIIIGIRLLSGSPAQAAPPAGPGAGPPWPQPYPGPSGWDQTYPPQTQR